MSRFVPALFLAVLVTGVAAAAVQQTVFRGTGDTVRVFVTVTDDDGRLVTNLTQDDFEVRDEGDPQPITLFDNTPQPIRLIVMLDVSSSMYGNLPLLRAASDQLFARLRPDDRVKVGTFGRDVEISPEFSNDREVLRAALPAAIDRSTPTALWRGVDDAMEAFGDEGPERRVILVLSDGQDSGFIFGHRIVTQVEVIDRSREENVMIYAIGLRSRHGVARMPGVGRGGLAEALTADLPDPGLARVALDSGGGYTEIRYTDDLAAAFTRVADELHSQYLLGFVPPKRDGKVHDIDVRVADDDLEPRARKSYVAPEGGEARPTPPVTPTLPSGR